MDASWIAGLVVLGVVGWLLLRNPGPKTEADFRKHIAGQSADDLIAEIEVYVAYGKGAQAAGVAKAAKRRFSNDSRFDEFLRG